MGTAYRKTFTKLLPDGAKIIVRKGQRLAEWKDAKGKNEASRQYRRLMQRALVEVHKCFDRGESFDITVDDGHAIRGYRRTVRIPDER